MKIHMLGIKGTGMSALAIILKKMGNDVSGSDIDKYLFTEEELIKNDIEIKNFSVENLKDVKLLICGHNFINSNNMELLEAQKKNIEILEYNDCLSRIIDKHYSIAVCGSSGKSTTTGLISTILDTVENTSYLIGTGEANYYHNSKFFTFEACEHKRHFLKYNPNLILINNIDYDHVDFYKNEDEYREAFYEFIKNSKDKIIVNGDDVNLKDLKNVITFGLNSECMFNARNVNYNKGIQYDLYYKNQFLRQVNFNLYGEYMVYNTLAALSCTITLGVDIDTAINGLKKFKGVKRRFKETIINDDVYIDDYAHHPCKIRAILDGVKKKYPSKKVIAFYRPDRIARLDYFSSLFASELQKADKWYILPFINNEDSEKECITRFIKNNPKIKLASEAIYKQVSKYKNVVYLMMSSKDVSEVKEKILKYKGD